MPVIKEGPNHGNGAANKKLLKIIEFERDKKIIYRVKRRIFNIFYIYIRDGLKPKEFDDFGEVVQFVIDKKRKLGGCS